MSVSATDSAIEIAYWFFEKSEKDGVFLENEKLHHLLFAAQVAYAQKYNGEMLMPSLFVVDDNGFSEPNLLIMFAQGRPFMPPVKLDDKVTAFLDTIWDKYSKVNLLSFTTLIKGSSAYKATYKQGEKNVIEVNSILDLFKPHSNAKITDRKKLLISQNGPVMVSKWTPRKVEHPLHKGI